MSNDNDKFFPDDEGICPSPRNTFNSPPKGPPPIYIFDIETGPLPEEQLLKVMPEFRAPSNYKDEAKIAEHIAGQREAWVKEAALDAATAQVLAIGVLDEGGPSIISNDDERILLITFWDWLQKLLYRGEIVYGFNIYGFDLPLLLRRSWMLRVPITAHVRHGRWFNQNLVDVMQMWQLGNKQDYISLNRLCLLLGLPGKSGKGEDFAKLWATDKKAAAEYLADDLICTRQCVERMR